MTSATPNSRISYVGTPLMTRDRATSAYEICIQHCVHGSSYALPHIARTTLRLPPLFLTQLPHFSLKSNSPHLHSPSPYAAYAPSPLPPLPAVPLPWSHSSATPTHPPYHPSCSSAPRSSAAPAASSSLLLFLLLLLLFILNLLLVLINRLNLSCSCSCSYTDPPHPLRPPLPVHPLTTERPFHQC